MLRRLFNKPNCNLLWARYFRVIAMPALSPTMEAGKVIEWLKKVGDQVSVGDSLCKIETDKAAVSFDNTDEDYWLAKIVADPGSNVAVGQALCLCVEDKEELSSEEIKNWKPQATSTPASVSVQTKAPEVAPASPSTPTSQSSAKIDRVFASPLAKKTAKCLGVDISNIKGTGGTVGRITKADVQNAPPTPVATTTAAPTKSAVAAMTTPAAASNVFEDIPTSSMRATIARRLTQSKNIEVPHYYLMNEARADNMLSVIKVINAKGAGKYKISVNDFLIKAIARANLIVPACNSHWYGDFVRQYRNVDVSVAVATPTGLITPIIRNAHWKGLVEISNETKELAKRAREGLLQPDEYQGGTVTISNLGGMAIPNFTAIINQPHSMILAVGCVTPKPEIKKNDSTDEFELTGKVEKVISFTASLDHRVVDGAVGAEWMKHFKDTVENPLSLLL